MTTVEQIERPNATTAGETLSPIASEALQLMSANGGSRRGAAPSEPQALTLTNPYSDARVTLGPDAGSTSTDSGAAGACGPTPDCETRRQFQPDPSLSSRGSREWQQRSQQQRQRDIEVGPDGRYEVKPGDSLWTLGERLARRSDGQRPSAREIQENMRRITEANPELRCNPNLLRRGERLVIPDTIKSDRIRRSGSGNEAPAAPQPPRSDAQPRPGAETRPAQPARPAQPGAETRPAQPARPAQPGAETRPAQPARPAQPGAETRPAQPARPAQPGAETRPAQPETRPEAPRSEALPEHYDTGEPHTELRDPFEPRFQNLPYNWHSNTTPEVLRRRN